MGEVAGPRVINSAGSRWCYRAAAAAPRLLLPAVPAGGLHAAPDLAWRAAGGRQGARSWAGPGGAARQLAGWRGAARARAHGVSPLARGAAQHHICTEGTERLPCCSLHGTKASHQLRAPTLSHTWPLIKLTRAAPTRWVFTHVYVTVIEWEAVFFLSSTPKGPRSTAGWQGAPYTLWG
jgi:hypothetical protein